MYFTICRDMPAPVGDEVARAPCCRGSLQASIRSARGVAQLAACTRSTRGPSRHQGSSGKHLEALNDFRHFRQAPVAAFLAKLGETSGAELAGRVVSTFAPHPGQTPMTPKT